MSVCVSSTPEPLCDGLLCVTLHKHSVALPGGELYFGLLQKYILSNFYVAMWLTLTNEIQAEVEGTVFMGKL